MESSLALAIILTFIGIIIFILISKNDLGVTTLKKDPEAHTTLIGSVAKGIPGTDILETGKVKSQKIQLKMQFTTHEDSSEEVIWSLILNNLTSNLSTEASAATSSFYRTEDGIECSVRKKNGALIASCYSESDRMGKRRWTIDLK